MRRTQLKTKLFACFALLCLPAVTTAEPLTYTIEGVFTGNSLFTAGVIGDEYVLTLIVDSDTSDLDPNPEVGLFKNPTGASLSINGTEVLSGQAFFWQQCCGTGTLLMGYEILGVEQFAVFGEGFTFSDPNVLIAPAQLAAQSPSVLRIDEFFTGAFNGNVASAAFVSPMAVPTPTSDLIMLAGLLAMSGLRRRT